jgi:ABC-type multidrug transport system fused ATPase/permease subunit
LCSQLLLITGVRYLSESEQSLVAIERTRQLGLCSQEITKDPLTTIPKMWPAKGEVRFKTVSARYRAALPLVIKDMDLVIPPHTKVGIVGRTGSGKSTLAKLLFRLLEVESGSITIDGLDIAHVDLKILRTRMTMIAQDPVLFAGSLRHSLDPADLYSEEELQKAVEAVGLGKFIGQEGLDMEITEGGDNISAGQRQLLCMARALVQASHILIMDEATSSMDTETDELIQHMLSNKFRDCTVITIAHRLDTIMDYDQVLVMSDGRVSEFGTPNDLKSKPGGMFAAMLSEQSQNTGNEND